MDTDRNGHVDQAEYVDFQGPFQGLAGDGRTAIQLKQQFDARDTNRDQRLDSAEYCGNQPPHPSTAPSATPTSSPIARPLTGTWIVADPAKTGPVVIQTCYPSYTAWNFTVTGANVEAQLFVRNGGGAEPAFHRYERLKGTQQAGKIVLDGTEGEESTRGDGALVAGKAVHYELTYDVVSDHLVGIRNGAAFQFAPLVVSTPKVDCGPPPP